MTDQEAFEKWKPYEQEWCDLADKIGVLSRKKSELVMRKAPINKTACQILENEIIEAEERQKELRKILDELIEGLD